MEDLRIRRGTPNDLDLVMRHRIGMFRAMGYSELELAVVREASLPYFAKQLAQGAYHGWFFENAEGRVVAGGGITMLDYQPHPRDPQPLRPYIVNVYTEPEYRRRGLARLLMDAMVEWCKAEGYYSVSLQASTEGRPLYEAMGFEPTNEMRLRFE